MFIESVFEYVNRSAPLIRGGTLIKGDNDVNEATMMLTRRKKWTRCYLFSVA